MKSRFGLGTVSTAGYRLMLAAFVALLLLAACAPAAPTGPAASGGAETAAQPAGASILRVAMQPIVQTDPAFISSDSEVLVANHVYDYLVDIDAQNNVTPRLATRWTVSEDGLSYVFQLAEGVTFHDGSPLTAADVAWTFNRLRDPALELPTKDLYANIADVQTTGDLEVTFTLQEPNPWFLFDLSDNHALVLKEGTEDAATNFSGTGPFKVVSYSPEDRIELAANESYFVDGQPQLDGLQFIFFNDEAAAVDALRGGQVDVAMRMSTELFTGLQGTPGIVTLDVPTNGFDLVRLRSDREPGSDPRVIQALKLATDREAIWQVVQQGYGAVGRDSPVGPLYAAYYSEETPIPARDVETARALLAEAGYGDGLSIDLHVPDTGSRPNLAVVLKEQWAEAGVNANVIVEPESVYYGDEGWLEVDLGITGWGSRPYPQFYLDVMLRCDAIWNESYFCDEEFDELATIAGTSLDEGERVQALQEIQRILIERGPVIIPYFFAQFAAHSDQVEGLALKAFAGRTDFRPVSLAQ